MKAIYYEGYSEADVLRYIDQPNPALKPDQVLVAVRASSVNPIDGKIRQKTVEAHRYSEQGHAVGKIVLVVE